MNSFALHRNSAPVPVFASATKKAVVANGGAGTLFYGTEADVDATDSAIPAGEAYTAEHRVWLCTTETTRVCVEPVVAE